MTEPTFARCRTNDRAEASSPARAGSILKSTIILVVNHNDGNIMISADERSPQDARKHFKGRIIIGRDLMGLSKIFTR